MGTKSTKLDAKEMMILNILDVVYNVDPNTVSECNINIVDGSVRIEAMVYSEHRVYHQVDGSLTDILYEIMKNSMITHNPYVELESCVKKYNDHVRLMKALEKQGLY